jgi:anaerobic nitric oxide reductase flavorubredoxin
MQQVSLDKGIFWVGVHDHQTDLFEGLWPVQEEGVTYNSYLISDQKTALIDLVKQPFAASYLDSLKGQVELSTLDYVVLNHMEPDHTSALRELVQAAPQVKILVSAKARAMVESYYGLQESVQVVQDGEELSLGEHTLRFVYTPFVHWPETMMTYVPESEILFSCDAFGGFGAQPGIIFDDQPVDLDWYLDEALRYFSNIVSGVSKPVLNAINKLAGVPVKTVAPSHGLVWRKHPAKIIDLYAKWAGYGSQPAEKGITIICGSMYGSTAKLVKAVEEGIASGGVPFMTFDAARTHASYILPWLWKNRGVVIASPTYEGFLVPPVRNLLEIASHKRMFNKTAVYTGSFTWGGGARRDIETYAGELKWNLFSSFDYPGYPGDDDLQIGRNLGAELAKQVLQD